MSKDEFLAELRAELSRLPQEDIEEKVSFYGEMLEDRIEDGLSQEEAVAEMGTAAEIAAQIFAEMPLTRLVRDGLKPSRTLSAWEIVLIVLGAPLWLPLLLAGAIILLAVYIVVWSVIISLYAVDLSLVVSALGCLVLIPMYIIRGMLPGALLFFGATLVCAGLAILCFFGFNFITRKLIELSGRLLTAVKALFYRRRG